MIQDISQHKQQVKLIREKRNLKKGILPKVAQSEPEEQKDEEAKIWFEVDKVFLPEKQPEENPLANQNENPDKQPKMTKAIAIDCEMVGVGENGKDSIIARVSLVNQYGECVYDKYVQPTESVTDYRTHVSGIRPEDLKKNNAHPFQLVQKEVSTMLEGRILVGHALHNDLQVLLLSHPKQKIRDTQKCKIFRKKNPSLGGLSSLKKLVKTLLGISIQEGEHNSVHDAQAAMRLYTTFKKEWEQFLREGKSSLKKAEKTEQVQEINVEMVNMENADGITVAKGSDNHKRYIKNKLKKRLNKKSFLTKKF